VVIVLDDLHHLSNSVLISDLGRLADLLPPNIHLVLSTRTDLPIAWSRHRVSDQVTEIRQSDLALDDIDSAALLEHITGRALGTDSVANLVARTEGWAAGLQLAGMTLRLYDDADEFITQFSGDDRLIADYLSEEVLQAQPHDRRELLLRVSVLDTMCAELVAVLTGESEPPARPRGARTGVDVPRSAGHSSRVVSLPPSLSGHASFQAQSRAACC
jgi:LuxR family maltose regulon positive regulatory protein